MSLLLYTCSSVYTMLLYIKCVILFQAKKKAAPKKEAKDSGKAGGKASVKGKGKKK